MQELLTHAATAVEIVFALYLFGSFASYAAHRTAPLPSTATAAVAASGNVPVSTQSATPPVAAAPQTQPSPAEPTAPATPAVPPTSTQTLETQLPSDLTASETATQELDQTSQSPQSDIVKPRRKSTRQAQSNEPKSPGIRELRSLAKQRNLTGYMRMSKAQLQAALLTA